MSLTVADLRDFVLSHLDTDETELPDTLLNSYLLEGLNRIALASQRWSFYEHEWSYSTTGSDQSFTLAEANVVFAAFGQPEIQELTAIQGPRWRLEPRSHEVVEERFEYTSEVGEPRFWSVWGGSVYFWPTPDVAYALSLRGYRKPTLFDPASTASDSYVPDLPDEFHPLLGQWMLGRAYQQQDDVVTSPQIFAQFERSLDVLRKRYETVSRATTRTVGGVKRSGQGRVAGRLLFPFE